MSERSICRARKRRTAGLTAGGALGATLLFTPAADAATFTVTSLADNGDGTCDGTCTLRDAADDANANGVDDVIQFQGALSGTITLNGSDIPIKNDGVDIQGPASGGITVSGAYNSRIFDLYDFSQDGEGVSISDLTLTAGNASGFFYDGGAINDEQRNGFAADLTLDDVVITDSHATADGGAVAVRGGAASAVDVTITDSIISGNRARSDGGALRLDTADVVIERSTVSGNESHNDGGALYFAGLGPGYNHGMIVRDSTLSGNIAGGRGGGAITAFRWDDPLLIENTTISGNEATGDNNTSGGHGGGVYLYTELDEPTTIRNSTIVDNEAATIGGGIYAYRFDNVGYGDEDNITISSSIVANNTATDGDLADQGGTNLSGSFILGFSLVEDTGTAVYTESPALSNIFGTDPQLNGLAPAGGSTETHVPGATSPVLDAGTDNSLTTDQRGTGFPRIVDLAPTNEDDGADIGAVERGSAEPTQTAVDSGPAEGSRTNDTQPTFTFSSLTASPTFECSLVVMGNAPSFSPCNSGTFTPPSALTNGTTYVFSVRETSGVDDPTPATRTFTVDTAAPTTTIESGPADNSTITETEATFVFSSNEPKSDFECSLDQGTPDFNPCDRGEFSAGALADGTYVFRVRAIDEAGNPDASPATRTFTVDTTAPETTIDSGPADGSTINDPTPTFGFSSSEKGSTFECSLDAGSASFDACSGPGDTHTPDTPLADGTYTFRVRATDAVDHSDSSPATRTFTVDTSIPPPTAETAVCQGDKVPKQEGTEGKDAIAGTGTVDAIFGLAGNDTLTGKGGKDCLNGGGGKDKLKGGGGKDRLKGGPGKDKLSGGGGKDRFNCGGGKDKVTAQPKDKVSASCEKVVEKA